ncbi:topology modulation protein [mine drainage metagenome]|uniref:Topology modulation protein n=1 Tax=mine drainage metagenome TaxID=410659 RepID=A0A1J5P2A2_9ZZZZ
MNHNDLIRKIKAGKYSKINVVGSPGSGKSSLSYFIHQKLGYDVFDLDDFLYHGEIKCKRKSEQDTIDEIDKILRGDKFIIDGTYTSSLSNRLKKVDLIILIDTPQIIAIFRFFKRLFVSKKLKCGERLTRKTFILILTFGRKKKNRIKQLAFDHGVDVILYDGISLKI